MTLEQRISELSDKIQGAYESQVTIPEAEALAAEFLHAQLLIAGELSKSDLDARMRKAGAKAIKSAVRMAEIQKHDKKPTEGALDDAMNTSGDVAEAQDAQDAAEVRVAYLQNHLSIFREAHIFFRGVSKGKYD